MKKLNIFLCLMVLVISAIGVNAQTDRRAGSQLKGGGKVGKVAPPTTRRDPETLRVTNVAVGGRVVVLGAPSTASWNDDVVAKLTATGLFTQVDGIIISNTSGPSLATLQQYQAVLLYTDQAVDNPTLGDTLADYSDGGGAVVEMVFGQFFDQGFGLLSGRFTNATYQVIQGNGTYGSGPQTLGTIPAHPIFTGVTGFNGGSSSFRTTAAADPAATVVATWADGTIFAATRPAPLGGKTRVDLNFYPPSSDVRSDFWTSSTDGARLMANALLFAAGVSAGGPQNVNSQVSFTTTTQGLTGIAGSCATAGYTNQYNINVALGNIGTNTLTNPFFSVAELQEANGVPPANPFRLRTADDFNNSNCTGGLIGTTQAIPGPIVPAQVIPVNFQIAMPSLRRFRFIVNVFATVSGAGKNQFNRTVKLGQLAVEATGFDKAGNPILSATFTPEKGAPATFAVGKVTAK